MCNIYFTVLLLTKVFTAAFIIAASALWVVVTTACVRSLKKRRLLPHEADSARWPSQGRSRSLPLGSETRIEGVLIYRPLTALARGRLPAEGASYMSPTLEQQIRESAYHLWLLDGYPHDRAHEHWFAAERQVLALASAPMKAKKRATAKKVEISEPSKPPRSSSKRQTTPAAALAP